MADNTVINAGTGGDTIATDDISGVKYQRVKVVSGADGTATDVSATAPLPVQESRVSTSTLSNVSSSATSVTVLASNSSRRQATVYNDSTAILYLKFGATASATSYTVQLPAAGYYELPQPVYTGILDGIWASANGNARVTELT